MPLGWALSVVRKALPVGTTGFLQTTVQSTGLLILLPLQAGLHGPLGQGLVISGVCVVEAFASLVLPIHSVGSPCRISSLSSSWPMPTSRIA